MSKTCRVRGCRRKHQANGLCNAHNMRRFRGWTVEGDIRTFKRLAAGEPETIRRQYVSRARPTINELCEQYGVSRVTIYRVLHQTRKEFSDGLQAAIDRVLLENLNR